MQLVIYRDNSSRFHWRLMSDDGRRPAVSADTFSSAEDARQAAADVHDHAGSASGAERRLRRRAGVAGARAATDAPRESHARGGCIA